MSTGWQCYWRVARLRVLALHVLAQDLLLLGGTTTLPCLGAVHRFALGQQIDQSLLRHFTAQVRVSNRANLTVLFPYTMVAATCAHAPAFCSFVGGGTYVLG